MTRPMPPAAFTRVSPPIGAMTVDGLAGAIDRVAGRAPASHRFLRRQWFAAALAAYGGAARTVVASVGDEPVAAIPLVPVGPALLRAAAVPGSYWPFRGFPAAADAPATVFAMLADELGAQVNALRIGPVTDGDPAVAALLAALRARGWAVLDRFVADSWVLDMAALAAGGTWPRNSTLRKNRFHEKHLAAHGALDWRFAAADAWPAAFDAMAAVEARSWIAARTDGGDAKFTAAGHGAFWRAAAADPVLAGMFHAAILTVNGAPAAFSFGLDAGALRYAIANSYDPALARHSPGKLLQYRDLADARGRGTTRVDWGAGDPGNYKETMGAVRGPAIRDWLLLRPGLPALAGGALRAPWRRSGKPRTGDTA